jgi:hypothetical protein
MPQPPGYVDVSSRPGLARPCVRVEVGVRVIANAPNWGRGICCYRSLGSVLEVDSEGFIVWLIILVVGTQVTGNIAIGVIFPRLQYAMFGII